MDRKTSPKNSALELELRNKIFHLVTKYAGSHLRELERRSKIPYTTLKYHLHYLVKNDLIVERQTNGYNRYYPTKMGSEDIRLLGLLRQRNIRHIFIHSLSNKKFSPKDLGVSLKLAPSTINWYLNNLQKKGFLEKKEDSNKTHYLLLANRERIIKILIRYKETFFDSLIDKTIDMWEIK